MALGIYFKPGSFFFFKQMLCILPIQIEENTILLLGAGLWINCILDPK